MENRCLYGFNLGNNNLGTPRVITDNNNTVIWSWHSNPFGKTAANEDPDGDGNNVTFNLRFPGQYYDVETGLHYNYFRDYDPSTGRYVQSDPIGLAGGLNTYGYVGGNPLYWIDPYGLDSYSFFGQGGFSAGTVGATAKVGVGMDSEGNMCVTTTFCGRAGAGVSGNLGFGAEHNTKNFCEGDSASGGVFGNVGIGLIKSASVTTDGDDVKTSIGVGLGGGLAAGSQACITKTICL